jgi:two-component system, NtrC family, response regulator
MPGPSKTRKLAKFGEDALADHDVTIRRKIDGGTKAAPGCTLYVNAGEPDDQGKSCQLEAGTAVFGRDADCDLAVVDKNVSRHHVRFELVPEGILVQDLGSMNGIEHLGRRIERVVLEPGSRVTVGRTVIDLLPLAGAKTHRLSKRDSYGELVGSSVPMRRVYAMLESLEKSDAPVLIQGETGTGKELTARALHRNGPRAQMPFVIIDCSNIPMELMESELFGHKKGAFTGAVTDRMGAFEAAHGGTVFLDEIDDLPIGLQPKLLRVLETGTVKRVGETTFRRMNVRIVATTKKKLTDQVRKELFRSDLYYRLAVVKIQLPPLRERPEDVPMLAHHLATQITGLPESPLSAPSQEYLMRQKWPGNVRQLRNAIERMLALRMEVGGGESQLVGVDTDFHDFTMEVTLPESAPLQRSRPQPAPPPIPRDARKADTGPLPALPSQYPLPPFRAAREEAVGAFEKTYLSRLWAEADGNVSAAARAAGIDRKYLRKLLKRHGLYG